MKLTIGCSYCAVAVTITVGDFATGKFRNGEQARAGTLLAFKCPACDSSTSVEISTKRKAKGKRLKATEAKAKAEFEAKRAAAVEANEAIAKLLLAQPGCSCEEHRKRGGDGYYYGARKDGLLDGGASNGMPKPPKHHWKCPLHDSDEEARVRGGAEAAVSL